MSVASFRTSEHLRAALSLPIWRRVGRRLAVGAGYVLVVVGGIGALLPWHLGLPFFLAGLILVLRSSFQARRQFIGLQHRHPRIVSPIRRLLRRDAPFAPVAWQQLLRFERLVMPRSWRIAMRLRHRVFRKAL
jgi:hypothetical protein